MIPANPAGGWDQTGRNLAAALQSAKLVPGVQFENKGGAAGIIGLAQFVNSAKISRGDATVFITRPISATFLAITAALIVLPWILRRFRGN